MLKERSEREAEDDRNGDGAEGKVSNDRVYGNDDVGNRTKRG